MAKKIIKQFKIMAPGGKATFIARTPAAQVYTTDGVTITPFGGPISTLDSVAARIEGASPKALFPTGHDVAHGSELWAAVDPNATKPDGGPPPPSDAGAPNGGSGAAGGNTPGGDGAGETPSAAAPDGASDAGCACTAAGTRGAGTAAAASPLVNTASLICMRGACAIGT